MKECGYEDDYSKCPAINKNPTEYLDKDGKCICHRKGYLGEDEDICNGECHSAREEDDSSA